MLKKNNISVSISLVSAAVFLCLIVEKQFANDSFMYSNEAEKSLVRVNVESSAAVGSGINPRNMKMRFLVQMQGNSRVLRRYPENGERGDPSPGSHTQCEFEMPTWMARQVQQRWGDYCASCFTTSPAQAVVIWGTLKQLERYGPGRPERDSARKLILELFHGDHPGTKSCVDLWADAGVWLKVDGPEEVGSSVTNQLVMTVRKDAIQDCDALLRGYGFQVQ